MSNKRKIKKLPETVNLPDGHTVVFRSELTGKDQRWFFSERGKLSRANGTGKPARTEPDPANPAQMKDYPAEPAYLTEDDNFTMFDLLAERLMVSCTMPGIMPWSAEVRDVTDIDVVNAVDTAVLAQMRRLQGIAPPKPPQSGGTGESTSSDAAPALPAMPTQATSSTPSA